MLCGGQHLRRVRGIRNQRHDRTLRLGAGDWQIFLPSNPERGVRHRPFSTSGSRLFMRRWFVFYLANYVGIVFFNVGW